MESIDHRSYINQYLNHYKLNNYLDKHIISSCTLHRFKKGELLCQAEDKANYFYFLVEGTAKVFILLSNGKSLLLRFYQPLNIIGDIEFLALKNYSVSIEALTECLCIAIPMDFLRKHYQNNLAFMKFLNINLAEKLNSISYKSTSNMLYPVRKRFASFLIAHHQDDSNTILLPSSYSNIAEMLGTTYRHLTRTLKELCEMNIIAKNESTITILDYEALSDLAEDIYIEQ